MNAGWQLRWLGLLVAVVLATGCSGVHLHNQGNLLLAEKAASSFEEADLAASVEAERARLAELLGHELAVVRGHHRALRDAQLIAILSGRNASDSWAVLAEGIESGLSNLADDAAWAILDFEAQVDRAKTNLERARHTYLALPPAADDPVAECPASDALGSDAPVTFSSQDVEILYQPFLDACTTYLGLRAERASLFASNEGAISELGREIADDAQRELDLRRELKAASSAFKLAKKALDDALASPSSPSDVADRAEEAKKTLEAWLATARAIGAVEPLQLHGTIEALDEVQATIDQVLDGVIAGLRNGTDAIGTQADASLRVLTVIPALAKEIGTAFARPPTGRLLLESEHLRLQRDLHQRRLANARRAKDLRLRKYEAMIDELSLLWDAHRALNKHAEMDCPRSASLVADFQAKDKRRCREETAEALLSFASAITLGRLAQEEADYELIGVDHVTALDSSEIALAQWENLIAVPISQLVALHGAGIKAEQLQNLIQALGLGAIASGVN